MVGEEGTQECQWTREKVLTNAGDAIANQIQSEDDPRCGEFVLVIDFAWQHSDLAQKGRINAPQWSPAYLEGLARKFVSGRGLAPIELPKTVPDPAIDPLLESAFKVANVAESVLAHRQAMAAENFIGKALESYIAPFLAACGWVWCSGEVTKAIDFVKTSDGVWVALQVKNRSNSENSSSSAIRDGRSTAIKKWYRSEAYKSETNWPELHKIEPELDPSVTELGFQAYLRSVV